jgi:hypothetical protein
MNVFALWFFSSQTAVSQYQSIFGQYSTEWVFEWHNLDFGGEDTVYVQKDTMVNGLLWKKIGVKYNWFYYKGGLLREDTLEGKVWYKGLYLENSTLDTSEFVLFDFHLNTSDTFDVSNMWSGYRGTTTFENTVDSIYYINDVKHVQFKGIYYSAEPAEPYIFIEGIGGNLGVLWKQYSGILQVQYLLCSYKDGIRSLYDNKRYDGDCSPITSSASDLKLNGALINVYPIPCSNELTIETEGPEKFDVMRIFNSVGALVLQAPYQPVLDVSRWQAGLYFLALQSKDYIITKTIIINH